MGVFQLCSLKIKNSRFLKSASDVGFMVKVAVHGAEVVPSLVFLSLPVFCLLSCIFLLFFLNAIYC